MIRGEADDLDGDGKKQCILRKGDETFSFSIPLLRIRELESML
jgi:hypothetical protein